jgi:flagellar biosynthesis protein FlhF
MHLKRYRGKTLKDALRAVRQDLGPNALVLSTHVVQDRGPRGWIGGTVVEIAAAIERPEMPDVSALRHTVNDSIDREVEALAARLGASGLEPGIARAVAASHPVEKRRTANAANLHTTLADQLHALAAPDDGFAPVEVFVGPPGAGKTTTIAKIAASSACARGRRLGLVAADGYRVGAVEQLRLYAEVIGAPLTVARSVGRARSRARHRAPSDPDRHARPVAGRRRVARDVPRRGPPPRRPHAPRASREACRPRTCAARSTVSTRRDRRAS